MSSNNKDYTTMTLEELVSEEKKMSGQKTTVAVLVGAGVGVAVYAATHGKFILPILLMLFALRMGAKHGGNLKRIQEEINNRKAEL